ncbi:MAG TPA: hypothetical protein PKK15_25130, partial [Kouleothrix sp.]|nr:hypothetical protein [Kouleothrix sp.]
PTLDLGDSEQTPSDLAGVADYSHLTAMMAPRWLTIANNAKDSCCFRADYAPAPDQRPHRCAYRPTDRPTHRGARAGCRPDGAANARAAAV